MRIKKSSLRKLISECISEMLSEASSLKSFAVSYKDKAGKDRKVKIKARDKKEAMATASRQLAGKYYDLYYATELDEMTTTGDVAGYDAPMGTVKRKRVSK